MSRTLKIDKDPNDIGCDIYKKSRVTVNPGVTVLVGCNGAGKTTLIRQLKYRLEKDMTPVVHFDNLHHGGHISRQKALDRGDITFLATSAFSSEGENISMNLANLAGTIGAVQRKNTDAKEIWIFLDAVDSGLSVDNVIDLKNLFNLILKHRNDTDVYIVVSANEYELARGEQCFDVTSCKYLTFKDYENYRDFIIKSREAKDNRVYRERGCE